MKRGFPVEQSAGPGAVCARGSAPGCHHLLAPFLAKEVIFGNKPSCLLGSVSVKGRAEGCCLSLTCWIVSLLFLSRNVLPLQVRRGCLRNLCRALPCAPRGAGLAALLSPAVRSANGLCQAFPSSASLVSQFSWLFF